MVKVIIFDLAEVYLKGLLGVEHRIAELLDLDPKAVYKSLHIPELTLLFKGRITEDEYWKRIIAITGWNLDIQKLKEEVRANFQEIEGTRKIIEGLRKRYTVVVLSIHAKEWIEYCREQFMLSELFHHEFYSFGNGICKPDPQAYKHVLDKLKVPPEECIFIDDQERNLIPARQLGIKTIRFNNPDQLKEELKKVGVSLG